MTIGERIQMHRKNQGLSQEELAQKIFVSRQTVSQWETDQTVPTVDNIYRLKEVLGVSFDELLSDEKIEKDEQEEEKPLEEYEYTPDEEEAKATIKFVSKFDIRKSIVIIGIMILLGISLSILEAGEVILGVVIGIILYYTIATVFVAANDRTMKKNQLENMCCRSQKFRLFDDCLEMTFISDKGSKSQYVIKKEDITNFFENEKYYAFISKHMIFSIRKDVLKETSILRNFIYKERVEESKKTKIVSTLLVGLSIVSGVSSSLFYSWISDYPVSFSEIGLLFLLVFFPLPLISVIYGLCRIIKKKDGFKNIIASAIAVALVCASLSNMVSRQQELYEDLDMEEYWNEMTYLDIPYNGEITNVFYSEGDYWSEQGCYSSSIVVYDEITSEAFSEQISKDERWIKEIPEEMEAFMVDFQRDISGYDFYCIYNTNDEEYSEAPEESGIYNFLLFAYDISERTLQVEDYTVEFEAE